MCGFSLALAMRGGGEEEKTTGHDPHGPPPRPFPPPVSSFSSSPLSSPVWFYGSTWYVALPQRAIELNNGRAAQMGILALMVHEKLSGEPYVINSLFGADGSPGVF